MTQDGGHGRDEIDEANLAILDNPAWHAMTGAHRDLTEGTADVRRYRPDVSVFAGVRDWTDPGVWDEIVAVVGHDALFPFTGADPDLPAGWGVAEAGWGVQLVETARLRSVLDPDVVELGPDDVEEMLAIVARNQPGPFLPGTRLMGRYLGIRIDGRLVAMAGERLHPPGWTEISAVCTDPEVRGRGYAGRLVLSVAAGIHDRGERALMHAAATNTTAIRLYEHLGFRVRKQTRFGALRTPAAVVGTVA